MIKLEFSIFIKSDPKTVWDTMLNDATYRQWARIFAEGSHFKGSWEKGSEIKFLGPPGEDGQEAGMYARIAENIPHAYLSINHLGMFRGGEIDTTSEEVKKWTPAFENYTFEEKDAGTLLGIEMDSDEEYRQMFEKMWPEALKELKALCEK